MGGGKVPLSKNLGFVSGANEHLGRTGLTERPLGRRSPLAALLLVESSGRPRRPYSCIDGSVTECISNCVRVEIYS